MNLPKITGCFILIWLPLATLKLHNINNDNEKNVSSFDALIENSKNDILSETNNERNETMKNGNDDVEAQSNKSSFHLFFSIKKDGFLVKSSAKNDSQELLSNRSNKSEVDTKIAHKSNISSSALISDDKKRDKSIEKYEMKKRKKRKSIKVKSKSKIFKRNIAEAASEIKELEDTTEFEDYDEDELNENEEGNTTELGSYLGGPCESTCSEKLSHVYCDPTHRICECEEKYPVQIGAGKGCEKPKKLGDQCFYPQTCAFSDPNAVCTQINHNAICQCKPGFHTVALRKGVKRAFCSEDIVVVSADLPTLLGVATGIAVLTGLICFVLKLFSGNRYPPARHYGNANLAPPLLISSDNQWINGIPLTVHGRPSSRSSCQRSTTSLSQYSRSKGVLVPASRAGAARAAAILLIPCQLQASRQTDSEVMKNSQTDDTDVQDSEVERPSRMGSRRHSLSSVQSTTSSQKSNSYSARRFEQENQQREQRAAMKAAREEAARIAALPTPSPMSTDEVLLIPASTNNEDELLCQSATDVAAQSEPPALSIIKGSTGLSSRQQ